jgi:hypothetical protein
MNSYQPPTHRMAFGFAAAAMTAVTIAVMVVLPARLEIDSGANVVLASSQAAAGACVTTVPESRLWKWRHPHAARSRAECASARGWSGR